MSYSPVDSTPPGFVPSPANPTPLDQYPATAAGGTVSRTLASHFGDVISLLDGRCKCDGGTDDYVALSAFVAALGSVQKTLIVPGPTVVNTNLTIPNNLPVRFEGNGAFIGSGTVTYTRWLPTGISGTSSGTNTGDVTIGTGNGLSLSGQALSLAAAGSGQTGSMTAGAQTIDGVKTFTSGPLIPSLDQASASPLLIGATNATDWVEIARVPGS